MKNCNTCVNDTGHTKSCAVLIEKMPVICFAWASEGAANKQLTDMIEFSPTRDQQLRIIKEKELLRKRLARREAI